MINKRAALLIGLFIFSLSHVVMAESRPLVQPAWMTETVIKDILAMNLSESQRAHFKSALGTCLTDIQASVHKISKRGGFELEKKIQRANRYHWQRFEKAMLASLSPQQKPIFQRYLKNQMLAVTINLKGEDPLHSIGDY